MKTIICAVTAALAVLLPARLDGQRAASSSATHQGFQFGAQLGLINMGNTYYYSSTNGNLKYKGSRMVMGLQLGYAYKNWSAGLGVHTDGQTLKSIIRNDSSFKAKEGFMITASWPGLYIKRYFMPLNLYVMGEIGTGTFSISEDNVDKGETESGLGWKLTVGKEFLIGKKENWGLGAFLALSGLKCYDQPPYSGDYLRYTVFSFGFSAGFH